jgi:hypothetical protein
MTAAQREILSALSEGDRLAPPRGGRRSYRLLDGRGEHVRWVVKRQREWLLNRGWLDEHGRVTRHGEDALNGDESYTLYPFGFIESMIGHLETWLSPCAPVEVYHHDEDPPEQRWAVVIVRGEERLAEEVWAMLEGVGCEVVTGGEDEYAGRPCWVGDVFPREAR